MIEGRGIKKKYGSLEVLKGIDISVAKGEVVSIVGDSGAGKTTLLQILGTLDLPTEGFVSIAGQETGKLGRRGLSDFRNKHIGFIFQFHQLLPEFNCLENVCIPAFIRGTGKKEAAGKAKEWLSYLGLTDRLSHKPSQLSGGEQQRVAVARALINSPSVIFADEPSGNLDSRNALELHELFFKLKRDFEQTIVIVTHNMELADRADRKLRMKDGYLESGLSANG